MKVKVVKPRVKKPVTQRPVTRRKVTKHIPIVREPKPVLTTAQPTAQAAPAIPVSAPTVVAESSGGGGGLSRILLIDAALALLAFSLVPTHFVVRAGLEPGRATAVKIGLAAAGVAAGVAYAAMLLLGGSS